MNISSQSISTTILHLVLLWAKMFGCNVSVSCLIKMNEEQTVQAITDLIKPSIITSTHMFAQCSSACSIFLTSMMAPAFHKNTE